MTPRERLSHAYGEVGVPGPVVVGALAVWILIGVPIGLHFLSLDLTGTEALFVGWAAGGFASAFLYILVACE